MSKDILLPEKKMQITNEYMDQWLIDNNKSIIRISNIIKSYKPSVWICLNKQCFHEWKTNPDTIIKKGSGCPKCAIKARSLSNEDMDNYLKLNNIQMKRLEDIAGCMVKIKWKCLKCNYIWGNKPNNVKNGKRCPKCYGNLPITNSSMDEWLISNNSNFIRCSDVNGRGSHVKWQCLKCSHYWKATPGNIKSNSSGCPKCSNNLPLTNSMMDYYITNNAIPIKRLGNIKGTHNKISWQCLKPNCSNIWITTPARIKSGTSCPICHSSKNELLINNFLLQNNIKYIHQFRISNSFTKRKYFKVDFFLQDLNTIIEYNGSQHYKPITYGYLTPEQAQLKFEAQQNRDQYIRDYCNNNQIRLFEIEGRKYKNHKLTKLLIEIFNGKTNDLT